MNAHLSDRSIISLSGTERVSFLQGLVTNDVLKLLPDEPLYAALLSPQGKFLHDFIIAKGEEIWLDVNKDRAGDLFSRLKLYKLRSDVTITRRDDIQVYAYWNEEPQNALRDPRHAALGFRVYRDLAIASSGDDYEAHRLSLAIPDCAKDMVIDRTLIMEFGFEDLHGVSFSKGCYVGQELVARSKFRAELRKKLYEVSAGEPLPEIGTKILSGDKEAGEIRTSSGNHGLAIIRSEYVGAGTPLIAGGIEISAKIPNWMKAE